VNISAAQFKLASDLDRIVAESLAKFGVPPCALELELTESVLMETMQKHNKALALQLPFLQISESMGNHDSKIVDADSVD
jgi:EAL domain-containing protein (putative c-di-GMP-specific phosphodiesterase class I)